MRIVEAAAGEIRGATPPVGGQLRFHRAPNENWIAIPNENEPARNTHSE
jgi:hypothetical protein